MKNLCEFLGIKRLSVKELCELALLTAITTLLAIYATFRIGNSVKIPLKFISVFATGALFGPVFAGLTGFLGDLLNALLVPVGAYLPQLGFVEFVSGFIYGLFFYKRYNFSRFYVVRLILCVIAQALLDIFVTTYFLTAAGYFPTFIAAIPIRLPATLVKMLVQSVVIFAGASYLPVFAKQVRK